MEVAENEQDKRTFMLAAIAEHQASKMYKDALDAIEYGKGLNVTITKFQKVLYTISGQVIPDSYSPNHKCARNFLDQFVTQEAAVQLGNGVTFEKPETKKKMGKRIDQALYDGAKSALLQAVSFGFYNFDRIQFFDLIEFVPLYDEEDGGLKAGIRFWQLADDKPLRVTLFEMDGYTEYIRKKGTSELIEYKPKRTYKQKVVYTPVDGETIYPDGNYPAFPIVPLWGNKKHQSELIGRREQIDCYDLIKSGFANDLDEASLIYWTLTNCGGMDDVDLAQFIQRMKRVHASNIANGDDGARAEAHTMDVPYQSREVYLTRLESDLYKDFKALDTQQIAAGAVTATQIKAAYESLNQKLDEFEMCLFDFFDGIFTVAGIDDTPEFRRSKVINEAESVELAITAAPFIGMEEATRQICATLGISDKFEEINQKRMEAESARFAAEGGTAE